MLSVYKKYRDLIEEVFCNDQVMVGALDKACNQVINYKSNPNTPCRSPEWVNYKYLIMLMEKNTNIQNFNKLFIFSSWQNTVILC